MIAYYRDEVGIIGVRVDSDGIDIVDGKAYFNVEGETEDRIIPVQDIVSIKEKSAFGG